MKKSVIGSRAFTLVELLVVIAIIALLTGIIMVNFTTSRAKARDGQRVSDISQIQVALGLYFDRCNQYPSLPLWKPLHKLKNGCPLDSSGNPVVTLESYISKIPTPPGSVPAYYDYAVNNLATPTDYVLHVTLENPNQSVTANSLPNTYPSSYVDTNSGATPTFTCDNTATSKDYCIGPK